MSKRAPLETKNKLRIRKSSTKGHFRKVWDVNIVGCKLHSGMRSALIFFSFWNYTLNSWSLNCGIRNRCSKDCFKYSD